MPLFCNKKNNFYKNNTPTQAHFLKTNSYKLFTILYCLTAIIFLEKKQAFAQNFNHNNPYSRFGIGELYNTNTALTQSLGGCSTAFQSPLNLNYNNPASYSALQLTTFETAFSIQNWWITQNTVQNKSNYSSVNYLSIGFPITKFWGSAIGVAPHTTTNYNVVTNTLNPLIQPDSSQLQQFRYIGSGAWYKAYWGNGFKIKNLSVGFNIAYLFGTMQHITIVDFPKIEDSYATRRTNSYQAHSFTYNAGAQYTHKIKPETYLTVGVSGNTQHSLKLTQDYMWEREDSVLTGSSTLIIDTTGIQKKSLKLPTQLNVGIQLAKENQWLVSADISSGQFQKFKGLNPSIDSTIFKNNVKVAFGVGFTPDYRAFRKFWKAANYRFGAYYDTGNMQFKNTNLTTWGITAGMGIPMSRINSRLNLSVEVGQQGSTENNLIKQTFVKTTVGITLNDRWFIKPKFD